MKYKRWYGIGLLLLLGYANTIAQPSRGKGTHQYVINVSDAVSEIQPTMYGIFFEDINFAADGGLYAEMIKNRSFEFADPLMGWEQPKSDRFSMNESSGFASAIKQGKEASNARFLRVTVKADTGYTLTNPGFRGMGVHEGVRYDLSLMARQQEGSSKLRIALVDSLGKSLGETTVTPSGKEWKEYTASFTATDTEMKARLQIQFEGKGVMDIDMVSLFPANTWKNRPKGMRADLVQLLDDLDPGFLRFPGGCIVEGRTLAQRYQWKKTVGDIEDRELLINRWNTEFSHRPTPDYFQSFGLGFFEYFQLAEDMGAEPLPILSCGIACQFNTGELVPMPELDPYVNDALDLIEFANGSTDSPWGKVRADMGHPEPFNMKYIGIGNEQWGPEYIKRYKVFESAIKSRYPEMIIVSGSGPFPDGEMFEYGMQELKKLDAEIIDEHYYRNPEWFLENADRYDSYDRNGPKIFAGEYAAQSVAIASPDNKNNWNCALAEAAFMTGLERNAEVVHLTSYAPLFAHADGWQWTPDLIWFNNLEAYATPNYYVQKLFSTNPGTHVLPLTENDEPVIGAKGLYASAVKDVENGQLIIKMVNATATAQTVDLSVEGLSRLDREGKLTVLKSNGLEQVNSFESPENISPEEKNIKISGKQLNVQLEPYSLSVLKVGAKELIQ
ncbi:alpha-L-arabinofuranosidase C-terminal domain-containing protein [Catalinimonas niigatensis]|uniref:alpha-L-arabinofuranosidase C-terminal domain-containing protein n=1 Tax=Catalinimonas niigatensis TaxID=1397264 RepID=UPI002665C540|nr:alpha-L-arabinofuranosidase C-terminal domain-containing protein [Catalinimonas niigatensis]WPP52109.1 alpha-L-arabinofuranosidase C-terminal domain-containing protein [Catalinimonas niigatensis]